MIINNLTHKSTLTPMEFMPVNEEKYWDFQLTQPNIVPEEVVPQWLWLVEVSGEVIAVCTTVQQSELIYRNYADYVDAWVVCIRADKERGTFCESRYKPMESKANA